MKKKWLCWGGISLFLGLMANSVTLLESIDLARINNRELLAEQSLVKVAIWQKRGSWGNLLPQVNFNSTIVRIDDSSYDLANQPVVIPGLGSIPSMFPIYKTTYTNNVTVTQSLFNGGKVIIGCKLAKLAELQARESLKDKANELELQVATIYFNLLKLNDLQEISFKNLESTRAHLQTAEDNFAVGMVLHTDVLRWQFQQQQDITALREVENSIKTLSALWQNLLGVSKDNNPKPISLENYRNELDYYILLQNNTEESLAAFLQIVKKQNPILKSLQLSGKMIKSSYTIAKGNFLPSFNLQFTYQLESDDRFDFKGDDNWNLAALVSVPLFTGGKNYAELNSLKFQLKQSDYLIEHNSREIIIAAQKSFLNAITTAANVLDNQSALEYAKANHKLINEHYKQGLVTNKELIDADIMLFSSEMNYVAGYYDFLILTYELKKWENSESSMKNILNGGIDK